MTQNLEIILRELNDALAIPQEHKDMDFMAYLAGPCGYIDPKPTGDGRWSSLNRYLYTCAILEGDLGDYYGHRNRWCYKSAGLAAAALVKWREGGCQGEPEGWHRHPGSGRRRKDGDPASEYVQV